MTPQGEPASGIAAQAAAEARRSGIDPRDVAAALYTGTGGLGLALEPDAQRRRQLRGQIVALQQAVDELEAKHPRLLPPKPAVAAGTAPGPRLPSTAELEQIRLELLRKLTSLDEAIAMLERKAAATQPQVGVAVGLEHSGAEAAASRASRGDKKPKRARSARVRPAST